MIDTICSCNCNTLQAARYAKQKPAAARQSQSQSDFDKCHPTPWPSRAGPGWASLGGCGVRRAACGMWHVVGQQKAILLAGFIHFHFVFANWFIDLGDRAWELAAPRSLNNSYSHLHAALPPFPLAPPLAPTSNAQRPAGRQLCTKTLLARRGIQFHFHCGHFSVGLVCCRSVLFFFFFYGCSCFSWCRSNLLNWQKLCDKLGALLNSINFRLQFYQRTRSANTNSI